MRHKRFRGSHRFICDRCRQEYRSDRKRKMWNDLVVCDECWEPRHILDFYKPPKENTSVPDPRPELDPVYSAAEQQATFGLTDENGTAILDDDNDQIQIPPGVLA